MPGLTAAADLLREWRADLAPAGVQVVALVLTPIRPGRTPAPVRRYRDLVADLLDGAIFTVAWHGRLITHELDELAEWTPREPPLPRRRRHALTDAVPADVVDIGAALVSRIAESRTSSRTQEKQCSP
jgi:hypothetical protein